MNKIVRVCCLMGIVCSNFIASAQESFYRVYQFETPYMGHLELTQWTTNIIKSKQGYDHFGKELNREHLRAYSAEAEYGVADHFVLAGYADFEDPWGDRLNYTDARIEARYRFGERYEHFINTAAYLEYYIPNHSYSNSQEVEARLILDKDIEDFRLVLNPSVSKYVNGDEDQHWQPGLSAGLYYRKGKTLQPGLEYYTNWHEKTAEIFPSLNINVSGSVVWMLGCGFGLTGSSDKLIARSLLQVDIQAISPAKLMRKKY